MTNERDARPVWDRPVRWTSSAALLVIFVCIGEAYGLGGFILAGLAVAVTAIITAVA